MAQEIFVVGFDGTDQHPVDFAVGRAAKCNAQLHIVHILEWSPYSFLTTRELAERHQARERELERAQQAVLNPILEKARSAGVSTDGEVRYGHASDILCAVAKEKGAAMVFVGRSSRLSQRLFGSAASGIIQCASVPVVIVP